VTPAPADATAVRRVALPATDQADTAVVREVLASIAPEPASHAPAVASAEVEHELVAQLRAAVARLREELFPDELASDAPLLLQSIEALGPATIRQLPGAAQEALAACHAFDGTWSVLIPLFEHDPMLTQALLREANSAHYATASGAPCVSHKEAMVRIGLAGVRDVLLTATLEGMLCRPGPDYGPMVTAVWGHMVRTGPLARRLAPAFGVQADQAFALGLLHDVGKLVLFDVLSALRADHRRPMVLSQSLLRDALFRLHEPLGGLAALRWGLGAEAARTIAHHHRDPVPLRHDPACELVFVAEKADLAEQRGETLDLPALWAAGQLSGAIERTRALLAEPE
jgi:HD-like signal output (HDOD) protein